jgi:two-component system nitrogen regulation sensor histidine kinase NtrY
VITAESLTAITLSNPAAEELFGAHLPAGVPLGESAAAPLAERVGAFLEGSSAEEEFDVSIGVRQLHGRLSRLFGSGGGAVLTLDDVTELARAQRVLAWGEMARQVAHEIKNPLTPIRLGVQHLRRAYRDGRGDFGGILDQNVSRILSEIDHLDEIARAFSRYGTAPEERAPAQLMNVGAVARDVMELERLGEQDVEWSLRMPHEPMMAIARADELREVLLNLLENARLAGAARVEMTVESPEDGSCVSIRVEDDGHGIPEDVMPRIFEPHFSTRTSGSGLGLAISRRMVEAWGGTVSVQSARGRGTVVTVTLASGAGG